MRLLLDTHAFLWFDTEPQRIPVETRKLIRDRTNRVYVSAISAWELTIKVRLGKLAEAEPLLNTYLASLARYGFGELAFTSTHALAEKGLSQAHNDPFDRALVAQALTDGLNLVSNDPEVKKFNEISVIWSS